MHLTPGVLVGCGGAADPQVDEALLEPLSALGECPPLPSPMPDAAEVTGLVLPEGSVVTAVTVTDPVTTVQGWIPLTPIQVRVDYAGRADLEVLSVEDEVWESEVLATDGTTRLFVKSRAACADASMFVAVIAPEDAADAVPTPAGSPLAD